MQKLKKFIPVGLMFAPSLAFAATIESILDNISSIINLVIPLLIAIALVVFIVGVIKYITAGADEEKRKEARNTIIYGVIGLFAIVAVWGLVGVIASTFGIDTGGTIDIPQLP
ncbi:MAG: pilin [Parcubacteria group bacterium]|nr:pilin [Parcubacteria group bacterium]MCR4343069.1 pilin [Patescibacteria group bacterium]